jgi:hypothetical protein
MDLMSTDACTLPPAARPTRLAELDALFSSSARSVSRDRDGVRVRLVGGAGLRDRVEDLAARESACCTFFTFAVDGHDRDVTLGISVPEERRDLLAALADRAEQHLA